MMSLQFKPTRRRLLCAAGLMGGGWALPAWSQPNRPDTSGKQITVVQFADMSPGQIDVSKDFVVGSRVAWQEINQKGGVKDQEVLHRVVELDASDQALRAEVQTIKGQTSVIACMGTVGGKTAADLAALLQREAPGIPHIAPWLQSTRLDANTSTFPIFASRLEQITHAVRSLSVMGVTELGAVYASAQEFKDYRRDVEGVAASLKMSLKTYGPAADMGKVSETLRNDSPRILIFLGGTPELSQFSAAVEKQEALRYLIAMSDVNLQTLAQMGKPRFARVIATQVVPLVNAAVPLVREYRDALGRLFDEPPSPQGLAGYLAARYTHHSMSTMEAPVNRGNLLQALQKRTSADISGFRLDLAGGRQSGTFVTQSMLSNDGRIVG
jgi:hypothetical protein